MLENAVYSVITVEGCAAILWKDGKSPEMRERAATALRITAPDLYELRVIDEIIPEPVGGAHAYWWTKRMQQAFSVPAAAASLPRSGSRRKSTS